MVIKEKRMLESSCTLVPQTFTGTVPDSGNDRNTILPHEVHSLAKESPKPH